MHDAHDLLTTLAVVLCLAAVTTVTFQRLRLPVVFGYLIAGLIASPHTPMPLVADQGTVRTLSELGVILLMFSIGLEFRLRKIAAIARTAGIVAVAETGVIFWVGFLAGQALGWTTLESVFAGATIAISSTTIIFKAFEEQRIRSRATDLVLGILIVEDLIAILLISVLTTLALGTSVNASNLALTGVRLASFLAILVLVGLLLVPRLIRTVVQMRRDETTLIVAIGICFAAALAALSFGYSVALGAFIAGSLVAESGDEHVIEPLIRPVRDVFVAIFFVSVGMIVDPRIILREWPVVLLFTALVIGTKVVAVSVASFFVGSGARTSVQAGMSMAQIGEFSFIIAGVGFTTGATRPSLYSIAIAVSAITTFATPWLIRSASSVAAWVDARLPHPVQTFAALYGSWIERVLSAPTEPVKSSRTRRLALLLLADAALAAAIILGAAAEMGRFTALLRDWVGAPESAARFLVVAGALAVGVPVVIGLVRIARLLGLELALRALPVRDKLDLAAAPRRAFVVTLQMAIILAVGIPLMALTLPFVPGVPVALMLALLIILGVGFWRSATNLYGHAQAGAQVIAGALSRQMADPQAHPVLAMAMEYVQSYLPGLGEPVPLRIPEGSPAAGKTLAELNLRGLSGATVLAIMRRGEQVLAPLGREVIQAGDVLALAGTKESIAAATALTEVSTRG